VFGIIQVHYLMQGYVPEQEFFGLGDLGLDQGRLIQIVQAPLL
jgi:hypothetical protein